jgi:hypothetical protein
VAALYQGTTLQVAENVRRQLYIPVDDNYFSL